MRILNLANQEKSTIEYSVVSFSDEQKIINLGGIYAKGNTNIEETAQIVSRMSWKDVQLIMCAAAALKEVGVKYIHLFVPYFLGARSDRKFQNGSFNYLKDVICPLINSLNFTSVTVLDPHSNCLEMGLKSFKKLDSVSLMLDAFENVYRADSTPSDAFWNTYSTSPQMRDQYVLVGPDKGSYDRVSDSAKALGAKHVIFCDKHRNILTGEILSIEIPAYDMRGKDVFILDDICDGGGTFYPIAAECKKRGAKRVFLVISHGIFSKGLKQITETFDRIYTTNSIRDYKDITNEFVMFNEKYLYKLIVKNVF